MGVIAIFAAFTFFINLQKQKQDLWSLRYNFFKRAYDVWGYFGYMDLSLKKQFLPKIIERKREEVKEGKLDPYNLTENAQHLEIINGKWISRNYDYEKMHYKKQDLLREANFLFGNDLALWLISFEGENIQYYSNAKEIISINSTFQEPFVVKFNKYLLLDIKSRLSRYNL